MVGGRRRPQRIGQAERVTGRGRVRRGAAVVVGLLALAGTIVMLAAHEWLLAVSFACTVISLTITLTGSRERDRAHRVEFEARLDRARQPPFRPEP
jgi:hypothetical protein